MILPQALIVFVDEKAEVAMAVLPFLLQANAGACNHRDFVEFISVSTSLQLILKLNRRPVVSMTDSLGLKKVVGIGSKYCETPM